MPITDRDVIEALKTAGFSQDEAIKHVRHAIHDRGMVAALQQSLRDNFALAAMQGAIAAHGSVGCTPCVVAARAYEFADAMCAERAKGMKGGVA